MVRLKKPPLMVTIGTALLMTFGGALAYWALHWQGGGNRGLPAGVSVVPETATAVISLSTNPEQWQQLRQFGTPETQASFDQQLADWRDRWLTRYDLSFNQVIRPWIGSEVTLAWLPDPENPQTDLSPPTLVRQRRVLLLPIADPTAAQTLAGSFLGPEAAEPVEYRGVPLYPISPEAEDPEEALWAGVLGTQLILIAEGEATAQQIVDTYRRGKSLADVVGYRRSFEQVSVSQPFGKVYVNVPAATQMLAETSQPQLPPAVLSSFQDSRGVAASLALTSQGIRIQGTSWLDPSSDRTYVESNVAAQLPQFLPRDTLLMASGANFQQFWQDLKENRTWGALTAFDPDNLALTFQNSTGLALENDLLPWMGGEFALALVPPPEAASEDGNVALPNPGLVVLAQVSDRPQAEQTFAQLDTVVRNRYRFSIVNEPVGQLELVKWISPFQGLTLSRGWLNTTTAFLTLGTDTEDAIVPVPQRPLTKAPFFQLTTGEAPYPNSGHFYINLEALGQKNNSLFLPALPVENQGVLRAIQALGVTATVLDEQRLHYDLYLALKRGNRPGPLPSPSNAEQPAGE